MQSIWITIEPAFMIYSIFFSSTIFFCLQYTVYGIKSVTQFRCKHRAFAFNDQAASLQPPNPLVWLVVGWQGHLWAIIRCPPGAHGDLWESDLSLMMSSWGVHWSYPFIHQLNIRIETYNSQHNTHKQENNHHQNQLLVTKNGIQAGLPKLIW